MGGAGGVGGGVEPGYFRIFLRKKSWPSHFLEWIDAWPFRNTQTKRSDPPWSEVKITNWKCYWYNHVHLRTKWLIAWRVIVRWKLENGQGCTRIGKREMCLWWMRGFREVRWSNLCGCLPTHHSIKDARYSSDSIGGTSAAGTSESASPEKWKDEDLGWFPNPVVFCKNSSRSFGPIVPRGNAFATVLWLKQSASGKFARLWKQ